MARYAPALEPGVPKAWLDGAIDVGGRLAAFDPDAAAPARAAELSRAPLLSVHGADDDQVQPYHADVLAGRAAYAERRVSRMLLPACDHARAMTDSAVHKAACEWFGRELDRTKSIDRVGAPRPRKI